MEKLIIIGFLLFVILTVIIVRAYRDAKKDEIPFAKIDIFYNEMYRILAEGKDYFLAEGKVEIDPRTFEKRVYKIKKQKN